MPDRLMTNHLSVSTAKTPHLDIFNLRQRLLNDDDIPPGLLREPIDLSWRRSLEFGVSCTAQADELPERVGDVETLLRRNRILLDAAAPELQFLTQQYSNESIITLADADATVLAVEGRPIPAEKDLRDLQPGYCWSESLRGTNALGTSIQEARPIVIHRGEHYLDRLSQFACISVPIKGPDGSVMGVLDVTRACDFVQAEDGLACLMLASHNIENRLFRLLHPDQYIFAIHQRSQYLDSPWQGLLAVDLHGDITSANAQACAQLGMPLGQLVGASCSELLGCRGNMPIQKLRGGSTQLQTARCLIYCKALQIPGSVSPVIRSKPAFAIKPSYNAIDDLAGGNAGFRRALNMAKQGLANNLPVLLLGETGTGKEIAARALHQASERFRKPFIAVNCAAIPEGLIESELFGYQDGAFTGSRKGGMVGRLMQANGGTLFLDEIGDMPLQLQARLLRVLQERKVAPLGAGEEQNIDVAVICATHRDLKELIQEKLFREDLYYRVNGVSLRLPALRERDDLASLTTFILSKLGAPTIKLDKDLTELFHNYTWPGNIRQLEMVLRSALAMRDSTERYLGLDHLTDTLLEELTATTRQPTGIRENELEMIRCALERHHGNVSAAADALGISRATLYRKLKQIRD